jgi:hypothetical protein
MKKTPVASPKATGKVQPKRKPTEVPNRGKPGAKLASAGKGNNDIFGFFAGKITITGDIVSPAFTPEEWGDLYPSPRPRRPRRQKP